MTGFLVIASEFLGRFVKPGEDIIDSESPKVQSNSAVICRRLVGHR